MSTTVTPVVTRRFTRQLTRIGQATAHFEHMLAATFPVGAEVEWERGRYVACGVVTHTSYTWGTRARMKVRNNATGREYWITAYDVISHMMPGAWDGLLTPSRLPEVQDA